MCFLFRSSKSNCCSIKIYTTNMTTTIFWGGGQMVSSPGDLTKPHKNNKLLRVLKDSYYKNLVTLVANNNRTPMLPVREEKKEGPFSLLFPPEGIKKHHLLGPLFIIRNIIFAFIMSCARLLASCFLVFFFSLVSLVSSLASLIARHAPFIIIPRVDFSSPLFYYCLTRRKLKSPDKRGDIIHVVWWLLWLHTCRWHPAFFFAQMQVSKEMSFNS